MLKINIMTALFHLAKKMSFVLVIPVALCGSGCFSYRLATHDQPGSIHSESATANSYLWGLVNKPALIKTPICDTLGVNGVSEVTVKTNFGFALITVVTLGIWCPVKLEWICSKNCQQIGNL
jgi:hypothetical protein